METVRQRTLAFLTAALAAGCATFEAPSVAADRAAIYGVVRSAPRLEAQPFLRTARGSYADPRYRHARLVSHGPLAGAVVWYEAEGTSGAREGSGTEAVILLGEGGFDREVVAVSAGGAVRFTNADAAPRILVCEGDESRSGLTLGPGRSETVRFSRRGVFEVSDALTEAAPLAIAVVPSANAAVTDVEGRYRLDGLPPSVGRVVVWHPRFPSLARPVSLSRGRAVRLDLVLAVGSSTSDGAILP